MSHHSGWCSLKAQPRTVVDLPSYFLVEVQSSYSATVPYTVVYTLPTSIKNLKPPYSWYRTKSLF